MADEFRDTLAEALRDLMAVTGHDPRELFGERVVEDWSALPGGAAFSAGVLEGAAFALNVTVLELLWDLGLAEPH